MSETTPPTEQQLAAIEARAHAATSGPWLPNASIGIVADQAGQPLAVFGGGVQDRADAEFTAHACTDVPALVAEVRRQRARIAELERPAVEAQRKEIRQSFTVLISQATEDRDHEGAFSLECQLREREEQWATKDAALSASVRPVPVSEAPEPHAGAERPSEADTLPAWLYQRFMPHGDGWDRLDDEDRAYWEHQARAVRRAVARGGFKAAAGSAVAATGDDR